MPETLNDLVNKYLSENGIKIIFLAKYLDEDYSVVNKWLKGKCNMKQGKIQLIHKFLNESYKSADKILKEE
jgi:hypothetical protein